MMNACACRIYEKPDARILEFTLNSSISACTKFNCLIGDQVFVGTSTYFIYSYNGTNYLVWYYDYNTNVIPNNTYVSTLEAILEEYDGNNDGKADYYHNTSYGWDSSNNAYVGWHIVAYSGSFNDIVAQTSS